MKIGTSHFCIKFISFLFYCQHFRVSFFALFSCVVFLFPILLYCIVFSLPHVVLCVSHISCIYMCFHQNHFTFISISINTISIHNTNSLVDLLLSFLADNLNWWTNTITFSILCFIRIYFSQRKIYGNPPKLSTGKRSVAQFICRFVFHWFVT